MFFLQFFIDDVEQAQFSGIETNFTQESFAVAAGTRTFEWRYTKDGGGSAGLDTAFVDDIVFPTLVTGDYDLLTTTLLTFTAGGPSTQVVDVIINGDILFEQDETFFVDLSNVSANARIAVKEDNPKAATKSTAHTNS